MTETTATTVSPEREEAEVAKLKAETEKLQQDLELTKASVRKAQAEAESAEHITAMKSIQRREEELKEKMTLASDWYSFRHHFDGPVDKLAVSYCLTTINTWHRLHPESEWEIVINSPGGSAIDGMHLFDAISGYSIRGGGTHKITVTVRGYAASMAGILLQAADVRKIGPEAWLMIHEISAGTGGKVGEMKDDVKWYEKMCERVANIFVTRSGGKITLDAFKRGWERTDWWLSSDEALEYVFVDEIG